MAHLPDLPRIESVLCTSIGRGQIAASLHQHYPQATILCSYLDLYAAEKAHAWLQEQGTPESVIVECSSDFPDEKFDLIAMPVPRRGASELARDLLQEAAFALREDGLLVTATDHPKDEWLRQELKKLFPKVTRTPVNRGVIYQARRKGEVRRPRDFRCEFTFTDQGRVLHLFSRPGVFSHRKLDGGARSLIKSLDVQPGEHLLDLGCGSGAVSVAAATRYPSVHVTAVDSNARAVECTRQSAELNGCTNIEVQLNADGLLGLEATQDVVVTNPPYYSHFRIAAQFVETAGRVLKRGGRLIVVTKQPTWFEENLPSVFGHIHSEQIGHYSVIRAESFRGKSS